MNSLKMRDHRFLSISYSFWFVFLFLQSSPAISQNTFRAMFYNVENLFDCQHDTLKNDIEYLPNAMRNWHYGRYKQKISNISKVISAVGEWIPPSIVGLCEVENDRVITDLVHYSSLKEYGYRYIMTHSQDDRGIDVALLYQRGSFKLLSYDSIRISFPKPDHRPTRDILHAMGQLITGDTLDVFVCHMPSRMGGEKESEPNRIYAAQCLKQYTDHLFHIRSHPNLLVMGDFNDYPCNRSISEILGAKAPPVAPTDTVLYNLLADKEGNERLGSYKYHGEWNILDQIIVSGYLLNHKEGIHTSTSQASIYCAPFLMEKDEKYGYSKPFRTYNGMKYQGGYSDHLPVFVDFYMP